MSRLSMNVENKILFQRVDPLHPSLKLVIKDSIGFPTAEKITEVLRSYELPNHLLIGAFLSDNLIGIIGYMLYDKQATIRHLNVLENFRNQGVGKELIQALVKDCAPNRVLLETDEQSVAFYKKSGFVCESFDGKYENRYRCYLDLSASFYKQLYIPLLSGGRVTQGVVRIDDTVRRPLGKNSKYTHKLLKHLEYVGFKGAPRFLGIDDEGREILSYIEGDVPPELGFFTDIQLVTAAQLIRQFHDVVSNTPLAEDEEVVNHNDLSPCNTVLMNDLPIALIDFDAAAPGSRVHDLAYAAWLWCDLGNEDLQVQEQARRIKLFCDSYGLDCTVNFISAIMQRQQEAIESYQHQVEIGFTEWQDAVQWGKHCLHWVTQNAELLRYRRCF